MNLETIKGNAPFTAKEAGYQEERLEVLDAHFRRMLEKVEILCAGYAMSRNGKMFVNNALGDLDSTDRGGKKLLPTSQFTICSITKVFTSIAILKLVEDGLIRLDQPVADIIPEFKARPWNGVQILHLLNHTSGILAEEGALPNDAYMDWYDVYKADPEKGWIWAILRCGMHSAPGTEWAYSSAGYMILGEIVTRVSGTFYNDYVMENVVKPCEMTNTCFGWSKADVDNLYIRDKWMKEGIEKIKNGEKFEKDDFWKTIPSSPGGLVSTCEDMIKFGNMLINNGMYNGKRIIGRKALEAMFRNTTEPTLRNWTWDANGAYKAYGTGIDRYTWADKSQLITPGLVTHEGYGPSCLMVDPEEKFVAIWQAHFQNYDVFHMHALRNTASVMWSGIE